MILSYFSLKNRKMKYNILIVGCGFSGSTLARKLAEDDHTVLIIDAREHIGGNAYDCKNKNGILVHKYGPHLFHTNSTKVWSFLSQYTEWHNYEHKVKAIVDKKEIPIPINRNTINTLYNKNFTSDEEVQNFYNQKKEKRLIRNSEDVIVAKVGHELYEKFFKHYTKKQWGLWPSELGLRSLRKNTTCSYQYR